MRRSYTRLVIITLLFVVFSLAAIVPAAIAVPRVSVAAPSTATTPYADFTPYGQIKGVLDAVVARSDRVRYEVIGQSAGGRDLYLVIVARPDVLAHLGDQLAFARLELSDPAAAQAQVAAGGALAPVFINCSIHGNEPNGTDAGLRLLKRLADADLSTDLEAKAILDNCVVLLNICQNPDGRVADTRANDAGFDLNRDFLTLTQPETRATAAQVRRWMPVDFLDLHGYYNPMRIEPCTPPHNPNYEHDLFLKWAVPQALAMRDAVISNTNGNLSNVDSTGRHDVNIPYLNMKEGFDDYSPLYTPQFAMYYGCLGQTLETYGEDELGTVGHYWASWGAMVYLAAHRTQMLTDRIEQLRRGVVGYQRSTITFPGAYLIPAVRPLQRSPLQAARMVDQLVTAGVRVTRTSAPFVVDVRSPDGLVMRTIYPAGSYIVPMQQALRGLANTWLWRGEDVSYMTNSMYSVCATSLPELLGFDRVIFAQPLTVPATPVTTATWPCGGVAPGAGDRFLLAGDSNEAVRAVNGLLDSGATVKVTTSTTATAPAGTFVISGATTSTLSGVASKYRVDLTPTTAAPTATKTLHPVKLGVYATSDARWILDGLGFHCTTLGATSSLSGVDVVVGNRTALSASTLKTYVKGGGGYVGIGFDGTSGPLGNLLPVTLNVTNAYDNNALVKARFRNDGLVGAYFRADDTAFVYRPVWFTSVGAGVTVDAWYGSSADWYICGYWRDRAGAQGQPAVVSGTCGQGRVVYVGFEPAFRAYPEGSFRLMANAIWFATK
jgi:hypothetical protein